MYKGNFEKGKVQITLKKIIIKIFILMLLL